MDEAIFRETHITKPNDETPTAKSIERNYRKVRSRMVREHGLALGILKTVEQFGGKIERQLDSPETQKILNEEPVFLIGTHDWGYEVLSAIGGIPESSQINNFRDVKLVSEASPNSSWLTQHTLPLYNCSKENPHRFLTNIKNKIKPPYVIDKVKAVGLNTKTLFRAGNTVGDGGLVLMCPEGVGSKNDKWQLGVAAILKLSKKILTAKNKEGYVVMVSVSGVGLKNYIIDKASDYIPTLSPYKGIKVRYSEPIPMSSIDTSVSGDEIVQNLENRYAEWVKSPISKNQ